jgi:hypothetical protein
MWQRRLRHCRWETQALDLSDDDAITPKATMEVIEPVAALLQELSEQDRQGLADLIHQCAHQETDPERQLTAWYGIELRGLSCSYAGAGSTPSPTMAPATHR